eukprot:CAMPEP_0174978354 /NCGR_PEP_ID=MMETSP0004_2-20121128/14158_1 /TAXON_ID=420556 /ORGANISM="Ochromonas sp., Strain CCMP1393" /LENGTH=339 /DNA_ID=CAMNT_0016229719 /DNA_START=183 /DNA_END=1198 /DNA_ORIENTATION=-
MITAVSSQIQFLVLYILLVVFILAILLVLLVLVRFEVSGGRNKLAKSCLYLGTVRHKRLKGGGTHNLEYPIFFSYLCLEEILKIGWMLWPIFKVDAGWLAFCSFDCDKHLKGWEINSSFEDRLASFVSNASGKKLKSNGTITLLTHLTYFGYCFNPVSFYYAFADGDRSESEPKIEFIITEVGNTPWDEQHSYLLHEAIDNVTIQRDHSTFTAEWYKAFHVSPFMEMDYKYHFRFSKPSDTISVHSRMIKSKSNDTWFSASFNLKRIPFTPLNLLYVLFWYPLHTRMIQVWIHYEAVKLYFKNIPTFEHPHGTDVNFGIGITGKRLIALYDGLMHVVQR